MVKAWTHWLLLGMALAVAGPLSAAEPERKDAFGDPLPPGAVARLGTTRFRFGGPPDALDLAPDGRSYARECQVSDTRGLSKPSPVNFARLATTFHEVPVLRRVLAHLWPWPWAVQGSAVATARPGRD
jgi:hypothetical protein